MESANTGQRMHRQACPDRQEVIEVMFRKKWVPLHKSSSWSSIQQQHFPPGTHLRGWILNSCISTLLALCLHLFPRPAGMHANTHSGINTYCTFGHKHGWAREKESAHHSKALFSFCRCGFFSVISWQDYIQLKTH